MIINNMTEKELQEKLFIYLSKYFHVYSEIYDITNKFRIDLIIVHKSDLLKKYPIGIEIKINEKKRGNDLGKWLKQASNYSNLNFKGFGKCLIMIYPPIQLNYLREGFLMNNHEGNKEKTDNVIKNIPAENQNEAQFCGSNNISTFLGSFNIGEILKTTNNKDLYFHYKGQILYETIFNKLRINNIDRLWKTQK